MDTQQEHDTQLPPGTPQVSAETAALVDAPQPVETAADLAAALAEADAQPAPTKLAVPPKQQYTPRPAVNGVPAGYQCGRCGLAGLMHGEPHIDAVGVVCEPQTEEGAAPADHPLFSRPDPKHLEVPFGAHGRIGFVDLKTVTRKIRELVHSVHPSRRRALYEGFGEDTFPKPE